MKIVIKFEYDTESRVCRVLSEVPAPPFGLTVRRSVLHDSHHPDAAKRELTRAVNAALKKQTDKIMCPEKGGK